MADVQGVNYAASLGSNPIGKVSGNVWKGRQRVLSDEYTASAAAIGTDILIGKLDDAAVIHDFKIRHGALGAGVTLQLSVRDADGNVTDLNTATAADSGGVIEPTATDLGLLPAVLDTILDGNSQELRQVDVIVRIAGGEATGGIKAFVTYVDG